ncbi:MAG: guanylate kinase [Acidobacteria bacterium]|nr:guanylate kinase [Acidobacteriota bacterium]
MKGNLFIISSPSGGGKGTLIREALKRVPDLGYSVSFTTREIRTGEENGKDYFFVDSLEFKEMIARDAFLEYAEVHGNYYGTSAEYVAAELSRGKDVILEIDVKGAEIVKKKAPEAIGIFILPPSFEKLSKRLIDRNTESPEELTIRLNNAKKEVMAVSGFDFVVINDEKEKAADDIEAIFVAERLRYDRQTGTVRDILKSFEVVIAD